jgi:histidinol phosphatase-like enzyme
MKYVFDIDGTICYDTKGDYELAESKADAIDKVNKLYDEGHEIVYFTARGMGRTNNDATLASELFRELTEQQLDQWGCKYHQLIMGKPSGDFYIDDKGCNDEDFFKKAFYR